jgi:hypothetical protein
MIGTWGWTTHAITLDSNTSHSDINDYESRWMWSQTVNRNFLSSRLIGQPDRINNHCETVRTNKKIMQQDLGSPKNKNGMG